MGSIHNVIGSMFDKFASALSTIYGWLLAIGIGVVNFFAGYELSIIAVVFCVFADLFWGIWAAVKQHKFAQSELVRDTLSKFVAYATAIIMAVLMDKLSFDSIICTSIFTLVICVAEVWSISGNILIVNPNIVFFRIIKPALKGEIAKKLNVTEDQVDEVLNKINK